MPKRIAVMPLDEEETLFAPKRVVVEPNSELFLPPRKEFSHYSNDYFQRMFARKLDRSGKDFNQVLDDHETPVIWQRASTCPNRDAKPGSRPQHVADCPLCRGEGYVYWDNQEISVVMRGMDVSTHFYMYGSYMSGTVEFVFPGGKVPNTWDRIILKEDMSLFSEDVFIPEGTESAGKSIKLRVRFPPIRVEKVLFAVKRENWPTSDLPPIPDGADVGIYEIGSDQLKPEAGSHFITVFGATPPAYSAAVVYWYRPQFVVIEVKNLSREAFDDITVEQFQELTKEQFESARRGWPITVVAQYDFLQNRTDISQDTTGHFTNYDGNYLRDGRNQDIVSTKVRPPVTNDGE